MSPTCRRCCPLTDAFVSVALAGATRDRELLATVELLPTARHLGTLLLEQDNRIAKGKSPTGP